MENLIIRKSDSRVCIVGNLNIDLIIRNVPHLPEWGQEVLGDDYVIVSSGQSAYTAFALRNLGIDTGIIGNVGDDLYGEKIMRELNDKKVNISQIEITKNGRTGISVAIARPDGERAFISDTACLKEFNISLINRHKEYINKSDLVFLVGLFFLPGLKLTDAQTLLKDARKMGKTTLLDTGWDPNNWQPQTLIDLSKVLYEVNIFIPNLDEARAITGAKDPEKAAAHLRQLGPQTVIIKLGAEGSYALTDNESLFVPPHKVKPFDAVGAGDVFNAGFVFSLLQNWPLKACVQFGNSTAALYISKQIDRFPSLAEVAEFAKRYNTYSYKI
jgi:sugar/nucleoside kinase (ribokinase family)